MGRIYCYISSLSRGPICTKNNLCKQMGYGNNRGTEKYHFALSKDGRGLLREKLNTL